MNNPPAVSQPRTAQWGCSGQERRCLFDFQLSDVVFLIFSCVLVGTVVAFPSLEHHRGTRKPTFTCPLFETYKAGNDRWLVERCFTSTETVGLLGTGAQDVHLDFHTAPELRDR